MKHNEEMIWSVMQREQNLVEFLIQFFAVRVHNK